MDNDANFFISQHNLMVDNQRLAYLDDWHRGVWTFSYTLPINHHNLKTKRLQKLNFVEGGSKWGNRFYSPKLVSGEILHLLMPTTAWGKCRQVWIIGNRVKQEYYSTFWQSIVQKKKKITSKRTRPSNTYILYASRSVKSIKYTPNTYHHTQKEKRKLRLRKIQQRGYSLGNKEKKNQIIVDRSTQRVDFLHSLCSKAASLLDNLMVVHSDVRRWFLFQKIEEAALLLSQMILCRFANSSYLIS